MSENTDTNTTTEDAPPGSTDCLNKYVTIMSDPPWGNQGQQGKYGAITHYDLMSIDAIRDMPVGDLAADNAHLYLWCYPAVRRIAEEVMEAWGFRFVDEFVWGKDQMGLGQYFRHAHETLLLGVKGKLPVKFRGQRSFAMLPRQAHSHKPEEVHQMVQRMSPGAFQTYAQGQLTIRQLAEEVSARGLATPATPSRASRPVDATMLHKMLSNPYYKGEVRFQGVVYPGRHHPLVDAVTWQKVQDLMASRVLGEKVRQHHLYLKSTVFCGKCESRLLVQVAKNRHGAVYEYFVCSGRHSKRNGCDQRSLPVAMVEQKVVDLYKRLQLDPETREVINKHLCSELEKASYEARIAQRDLAVEHARLDARSRKLLDAHLDGTIPAELYREEQQAISRQLAAVAERLSALATRFDDLEGNLRSATELAGSCFDAYRRAPDSLRRTYNQAFFKRVLIWEDDAAEGEFSDMFELVFTSPQIREERKEAENRVFSASKGSNDETLVRLLGRYLNSRTEVERLRDLCSRAASERVERTPVSDKPPRTSFSKLKSAQCDEILRRYQAGDRPVDIARDFGVTEWTIQNVRKRAGVPTRPHGMNDAAVVRAVELKANGLSIRKIAIEVGYDPKTVSKELRVRGITP